MGTIVGYLHVLGGMSERGCAVGGLSRCCFAQKRFASGTRRGSRQSGESFDVSTPNANATPRPTETTHTTQPKPELEPKPESERSGSKQRHYPRIHLLNPHTNPLNITPATSPTQLNTSLAPSNSKPTLNFPRPPYLSTKLARLIPAHAFTRLRPDSYVLARSVEVFGLPGQTDWVAGLSERLASGVVLGKVTGVLSRLEWTKRDVMSLKEAAWAEHLVAMQNPRLGQGMDDFDAPSAPAPTPGDRPNLSWSTSGERDEPLPTHTSTPAHAYGKHNFPRPKRIIRLRAYDKSLVLVLASPAARRAVLAAYAYWIRRELGMAFNEDKEIGKGPGVWPPVTEAELGGVRRGDEDYEMMFSALEWAARGGWRPAFRIRPFEGMRRWGDEWHPRGRWSVGHGGDA
ncbi:hypothetical protein FRC08_016880, partial [Ceratobasidium sp. 394]